MNLTLIVMLAAGQGALPPEAPKAARPPSDAEARKQARDEALKVVGEDGLPFTRRFGTLGVEVLSRLKPETAKALLGLYRSGAMDRLKSAEAVLNAVRYHSQPAGEWLVTNIDRLNDPEAMQLWCRATLDYVFDLRDLEADAAQMRTGVQYLPRLVGNTVFEWGAEKVAIIALAVLLIAVVLWKRRASAPPP